MSKATGKRTLLALGAWLMLGITLVADVIHFKNGTFLIVGRAWEEADTIRYETIQGVKVVDKSSVSRIQHQEPTPSNVPAHTKYGIGLEVGSSAAESTPRQGRVTSSITMPIANQGVSEEVVTRLKENVRIDPADVASLNHLVSALNSLASLQLVKGDFANAKSSLQLALSYNKRNAATLMNLAIVCYQSGEYRAAEDAALEAVQLDPKAKLAHHILGEVYYAQDKVAQAIAAWKTALQLGADPEISARLQKAEQEVGTHAELGILQSAHFILRYDRQVSDYRLGQQILDSLEQSYRQLSLDLSSVPPDTVTVILYPNQTYFDITRAPNWSGALFDGKIRVPIKGLSSVTPHLSSVLIHELAHCFVGSATGHRCPSWFDEGVAQRQEGKSAASYSKLLSGLRSENKLLPLKGLEESFGRFPQGVAELAYLEGLSAVEYLSAAHGRQASKNILDLARQGHNFESAFLSVTRQSLEQFEKAWHSSLTR